MDNRNTLLTYAPLDDKEREDLIAAYKRQVAMTGQEPNRLVLLLPDGAGQGYSVELI